MHYIALSNLRIFSEKLRKRSITNKSCEIKVVKFDQILANGLSGKIWKYLSAMKSAVELRKES